MAHCGLALVQTTTLALLEWFQAIRETKSNSQRVIVRYRQEETIEIRVNSVY